MTKPIRIERSGELEIDKIPAGYDAGHDVFVVSIGGKTLAEIVASECVSPPCPCRLVLEIEEVE